MNIVLDVLRYLNEHDITLVKAAEATGVAQQNIKKSIGNNPKTSTLLTLAKGLGVDPREFFYDLDESKENDVQENIEETHISVDPEDTELKTEEQNDMDNETVEQTTVNTTTFCPHCGAKVRVGVLLMPE